MILHCELRMSPFSCPSLTTATTLIHPKYFASSCIMPPRSRTALHRPGFPLLHTFHTWQSLLLSLEASSNLSPLYRNLEKNRKHGSTCSQIHFQLHPKSRLNCLPYTLSLHACQGRNPHKPHEKAFIAAVVTCTSVHQSCHVGMTLARQIFLQPSILKCSRWKHT